MNLQQIWISIKSSRQFAAIVEPHSEKTDAFLWRLFWAISIIAFLPWLFWQPQMAINANIAWLMECALRFLDGGSMAEDFYETNPPLGFLIYLPPALITKWFQVPAYYTSFFYTLSLLFLCTLAVQAILKKWGFLSAQSIAIITVSYITSNTILLAVDFGERDHILAMSLLPFILVQFSLTYKLSLPSKLQWAMLAIGATLILLKPPYGLLPTLFLIHRAWKQKRFLSMIKEPDFICLALATLSYLVLISLYFRDYATIIFPDMIDLYVTGTDPSIMKRSLFGIYLISIPFLLALFTDAKERKKTFIYWTLFSALICIIPFFLQMKGYYYHLSMTRTCYTISAAYLFYIMMGKVIKNGIRPLLSVIVLYSLLYSLVPLNSEYPRHKNYNDLPVSQFLLQQTCKTTCSFFMFDDNMGIIHPTALYTGHKHGSRFPALWFLPRMVYEWSIYEQKGHPEDLTERKLIHYMDKYTAMVALDLKRYKPDILLIGRLNVTKNTDQSFDFIDFFSYDPSFKDEILKYKQAGTLKTNRRFYYPNTLLDKDEIVVFDVYERVGL